ncbi:MAG TPA: hypothetical protein VFB34_12935, partial [Chloroflexota bacterium]|nr:hypothetical protein [Chloroflexota bacterium]
EALLGVVGSDSTSVPVGRRRRRAGRGRPRLGEESGRVGEALLELLHHPLDWVRRVPAPWPTSLAGGTRAAQVRTSPVPGAGWSA